MTGSPTRVRDRADERVVLGRRQALEVWPEDDRAQVRLERLARLEAGRLVGQPALDVDEAGGLQPARRGSGVSK